MMTASKHWIVLILSGMIGPDEHHTRRDEAAALEASLIAHGATDLNRTLSGWLCQAPEDFGRRFAPHLPKHWQITLDYRFHGPHAPQAMPENSAVPAASNLDALAVCLDREDAPLNLGGGLGLALKFVNTLCQRLQALTPGLPYPPTVGGIATEKTFGLFVHDEVRGRLIRITQNTSTDGIGRLYLGASDDFEFPSRLPKESEDLEMLDFEESALSDAVDHAVEFLSAE